MNIRSSRVNKLRQRIATLGLVIIFSGGFFVSQIVRADQFDAQINALRQQNSSSQQALNQLEVQASSYQDAINKLQAQINALQQQINANTAKSNDLKNQIVAAEAELARQRKILGESIRAMYLEGQITTLEMLASSKDLSDFVDKQEYRSSVQDKIKNTLDKITALKQQLKTQKELVDKLLVDEQTMDVQLAADQAQQAQLLAYNQQQQDQYNQKVQSNLSQIASLRAQQAVANRALGGIVEAGDPNHGGYPGVWDQAPQDSLLDNWGMWNRECVSYTAWKVYQRYGYMPYWGGHGNANQWPASAASNGIPTGSTPHEGSVAISMAGYYGHDMWVEYVLPNGYIHVSQYNYDLAGHYSEMTINGNGLTYIYFH
ncbi:CHAP domain-containing protein [Candidatus Saccharibacteria bacterium]|nr:CHAP domain-containing protein [Candidatus Saccharibacteria bacterium]